MPWRSVALAMSLLLFVNQTRAADEGSAEVYVVTIDPAGTTYRIVAVDGVSRTFLFKKHLRLPPGAHDLRLQTSELFKTGDSQWQPYVGRFTLSFEARAGQTYTFAINSPDGWPPDQICVGVPGSAGM